MDEVLEDEYELDYDYLEFDPEQEQHYESPLLEMDSYGHGYVSNFYLSHVGRLFIAGLMTTSAIGPGRIWTANTTTELGSVSSTTELGLGYPYGKKSLFSSTCCNACSDDFPDTIMFNYQNEANRCVCLKATPETTPTTKAPYVLGKCDYRTYPGKFCTENGVYLTRGPVLKEMASGGEEDCSSLCSSTGGCVAWTLRLANNQCYLVDKSHDLVTGRGQGWITGTRDCGINRGTPLGLITPSSVDMIGEVGDVGSSERCCEECSRAHNGTEMYAYIDTDEDTKDMFEGDKDNSCVCFAKKHRVKPVTEQSNFYAGVCGGRPSGVCTTTPSRPDKTGALSQGNATCIFPFRFFGVIYYSCAPGNVAGNMPEDSFWCSTKVDEFGNHVRDHWGFCSEGCP